MDRFFAKRDSTGYSTGSMRIIASVMCLLLALVAPPLRAADRLDTVPRVAVVSAFEPEWKVLKAGLAEAKSHHANGVEFVTGTLAGRARVTDIVDTSVVEGALRRGDLIISSDEGDLAAIAAAVGRHVDIGHP